MNQSDRRLELEIALRGDIGSPIGEMKVIGEFDRLQGIRFDESVKVLPAALVAFTVDLTATTIIDSAALGSLVRLRHALDRIDCRLEVVVSRPFQVTVMRVGGLYEFLNVRDGSAEDVDEYPG